MSDILEPATRSYVPAASRIMKEEMGRVVWPTAIASAVIIVTYLTSLELALSGVIPVWVGCVLAFLCIHPSAAVLHEASHRAITGGMKGQGWLDYVIGTLHGWMLTYDFGTFRYLHMRHHQNTNDPAADPDFWMQGRHPLVIFFLAMFVPLHYLRLYIDCVRKGLVPKQEYLLSFARIIFIIAAIITALLIAPGKAFLLWIFPASIASAIVNLSHSMLHRPVVSSDRRMTTLIVRGERFWEWVVSPFFWLNNHHFLHHEFPRAPFTAHARMFREVEDELRADGVRIITVGNPRPEAPIRARLSA